LDWQPPAIVRQLDKLIGNRKELLKFSYLIVRRDQRRLTDALADELGTTLWRLVSDPHSEKGKTSIFGCGGGNFLPLVRLKRSKTEANLAFERVERSQLARLLAASQRENELRIEEETAVELYGPFLNNTNDK